MEESKLYRIQKALEDTYRHLDMAYWQLHETGNYDSDELDKAVNDVQSVRDVIEDEITKVTLKLDKTNLQNPYAHVEEISNG